MEQKCLGRSGLSISRVGLGCVTLGREIDERLSFRLLDHALTNGINLLDTAESYGGGDAQVHRLKTLGISEVREKTDEMHSSEKIIGRWLTSRRCRNRVVIQTKISGHYGRSKIKDSIDASLKRLKTDWIDIYLLHSYSDKSSLAEAVEALDRAVQEGKIRAAGCSNFSSEQIGNALVISGSSRSERFEAVQSIYNLVFREIENDVIPLCLEHNIGVIGYSPLGAGFLTGKYSTRDAIPKGSRFDIKPGHADIYFRPDNFLLLERLRKLSRAVGTPMSRLALAWALSNSDLTSVLIGATSLAHIDNGVIAMGTKFHLSWKRFILGREDQRSALGQEDQIK